MKHQLALLLGALGPFQGALAGTVVFDNTLPGQHGAPTPVNPVAGTYTIDSASGYLTGTNLFQSFLSFSIDSGQTALFTNTLQVPIGNVVSRVTGGSPSVINGTLTSQIFQDPGTNRVGANFWFVNPAGVTFGNGASVNVPAGFAVGAADYISFADGARFYALPSNGPQPAVFTTASPAAFGFLATPAAAAVTLQGNTIATSGPIMLSAGPGGVSLTNSSLHATNSTNAATGPGVSISTDGGAVSLQSSSLDADTTGSGPAGSVNVASGGALSLTNSNVLSETFSFGNAGNINLSSSAPAGATGAGAGALSITGGLIATRPNPAAAPEAGEIGGPGNVTISGPSVYVSGATIESTSKGFNSGGTVAITGSGADSGPAGGGAGDAVYITGAATLASNDGDNHGSAVPGGVTIQASAGSVRIDGGSAVNANNESGGVPAGGPVTVSAKTALTLDDASIASNSTFNLAGNSTTQSDIALQSSGPISLASGATVTAETANTHVASANISISTPAAVTFSGNSALLTAGQPVGSISVQGGSIHVTGGSITVLGVGSNGGSTAPAGGLTLEATGADSGGVPALLVDGGAQITGDTQVGVAGNISLSANMGTVSLVGTPGTRGLGTIVTSSAEDFGYAGTVTLAGQNVSLNGATVQTTQSNLNPGGQGPATIAVTASGNVGLVNSVLDARTSGGVPAGDIQVSGSSVSISGGSVTASTVGLAAAGSVSITATGAQGVNGAAALQVSDGAAITSDASGSGYPLANAGSVTLSAPAGTVQVGLPTDTAPSSLSTASGTLGAPGTITISGAGIALGDAQVSTTTGSTQPSATRGSIVLDAGSGSGSLSVANSSLDAATSGVQQAGEIDLLGAPITLSNSTISSKTTGAGAAGAICVGTPGCVASGTAVPATGGSISISGSTLTTSTSTAAAAGDIQVNGSSVSVSGGQLTASTTGTGNAGNVSLTATGASATALQVSGGATINSDASGGASPDANAGYVKLNAPAGTVQVGLSTDSAPSVLSSEAGPSAGAPGTVTITGAAIALGDAKVSTTAAGAMPSTIRGTILLDAGGGSGSLSLANSSLDAATSGVQQAGEIDLVGSPISISNSTISSATTGTGPAGAICVATGSQCASVSSAGGSTRPGVKQGASPAAGGITISDSTLSTSTSTSGNAGSITISTPDALTLSATSIASQSTSAAANAGSVGVISLTGGSVSILDDSTISAQSNGGVAGVPGGPPEAITINSTDGTTPIAVTNSTISTKATVVNGSNIAVNANGSPVNLRGSVLTASAAGGNGGNITISDAGNTTLADGAIVAQAGPGNGGAINIKLRPGAVFVQDSQSIVSATSQTGNNGTVSINSPQTDLNSALRVPEVSVARPPELAANACTHDASHSTFVREGRGGVAPGPDGYLSAHPESESTPAQGTPSADTMGSTPPLLLANIGTRCR